MNIKNLFENNSIVAFKFKNVVYDIVSIEDDYIKAIINNETDNVYEFSFEELEENNELELYTYMDVQKINRMNEVIDDISNLIDCNDKDDNISLQLDRLKILLNY